MSSENSLTEPRKRSRRVYLLLVSAILLLVVISGAVAFELTNPAQDNNSQNNYGPGPIGIAVTADKTFYLQGELINFTIYLNNPQDWPVPCPQDTSYKIRQDDYVVSDTHMFADYFPGTINTLPANSRASSFYLWNSESVPSGNYTLTVTYYGLVDYGEGGSCTFEIR